jgi:hypothetical protein
MSTMTRGPSFHPESELNTPNECPTYPLRARTAIDANMLVTQDKMKMRTVTAVVASASASATPSKAVPLRRKHTTKELISLYESAPNMSTTDNNSNGVPRAPPAYSKTVRSRKLNLNAPLPELPQSKPLRGSFKNLLAVFGKKRATKQKHDKSRSVSPSMGRPQPDARNPALGAMDEVVLPSKTVESVGPAPTTKFTSPSVSPVHRHFI